VTSEALFACGVFAVFELVAKSVFYLANERLWSLARIGLIREAAYADVDSHQNDRESLTRSLLKGMTYGIPCVLPSLLIVLSIQQRFELSFAVVAIPFCVAEFSLRIVLFVLWERAWQAVPRGTVRAICGQSSISSVEGMRYDNNHPTT